MTGEFAVAVHALVYLNHKGTIVSSEELAENICTNPARVRKILSKLKKAKLLVTKEGLEGGYFFHQDASKVTLREISDAVQAEFVTANWKSGNKEKKCLVASGMADIMAGIYQNLDELCKKSLEGIRIVDIDKQIFKNHL